MFSGNIAEGTETVRTSGLRLKAKLDEVSRTRRQRSLHFGRRSLDLRLFRRWPSILTQLAVVFSFLDLGVSAQSGVGDRYGRERYRDDCCVRGKVAGVRIRILTWDLCTGRLSSPDEKGTALALLEFLQRLSQSIHQSGLVSLQLPCVPQTVHPYLGQGVAARGRDGKQRKRPTPEAAQRSLSGLSMPQSRGRWRASGRSTMISLER